ncbi:MAG: FecR domain-containing protein [Alphaproteobacteria bacterium]
MWFIARAFIVACAGIFALAAPQAHAQESGPGAYVATLVGAATVVDAAGERPLAVGDVVAADGRIRTGDAARVMLVLDDGTRVVIGPETEIALQLVVGSGAGVDRGDIIELLHGILRVRIGVPAPDSDLQTVSPTAVVAARSTEWTMDHAGDSTAVLVLSGVVAVTSTATGDAVALSAGLGTDVPAGGAPSAPREWGAARAADARARTSIAGAP